MGDESGFATRQRESGRTGGPAVTIEADGLPQLSCRSRALLIRFVEATGAFRRPIGLPTVAFTEAQVYNLRRVLTDETIRMSYSTMERIVTDAVRSTPTTPHQRRPISVLNAWLRRMPEKSEAYTETGIQDETSFFGESDSPTEVALISKSFKQTPGAVQSSTSLAAAPSEQQTGEVETSYFSSLGVAREGKGEQGPKILMAMKQKKTRRPSQRELQCLRSSSKKPA